MAVQRQGESQGRAPAGHANRHAKRGCKEPITLMLGQAPRGSRILRFTFHPSCSRFTWKVVFQKWVVLENHNGHRRPLAAEELPLCRSSLQQEVLGACPWVGPGEP